MDTNENERDFETLIALAQVGDSTAIATIVQRYESEVHTVIRRRLGKAMRPYFDSIDVLQSVHKSLLIGLKNGSFQVSNSRDLVALASTLVRRKIARHWRKMRRQQRSEGPDSSALLPEVIASISSQEIDPAVYAQTRNELENLFLSLSETEKQVVELKLEGLTTAEVAQELRLDADVLRVQLSRLRKRLRARGVLAKLI